MSKELYTIYLMFDEEFLITPVWHISYNKYQVIAENITYDNLMRAIHLLQQDNSFDLEGYQKVEGELEVIDAKDVISAPCDVVSDKINVCIWDDFSSILEGHLTVTCDDKIYSWNGSAFVLEGNKPFGPPPSQRVHSCYVGCEFCAERKTDVSE